MSGGPTKEQIEKLPQWAQNHIRWLERKTQSALELVEEVRGSAPKSAVAIHDTRDGDYSKFHYIPKHAHVLVFPRSKKELQVHIREGAGGELQCEVSSTSGAMHVLPRAGNSVQLVSGEW